MVGAELQRLQNNEHGIILIVVACQLLWGLEQEACLYVVTVNFLSDENRLWLIP